MKLLKKAKDVSMNKNLIFLDSKIPWVRNYQDDGTNFFIRGPF